MVKNVIEMLLVLTFGPNEAWLQINKNMKINIDGLKETKMFLPHPLVKLSIVGNLRDREVACSASDFLAQFSLYMHKSGL